MDAEHVKQTELSPRQQRQRIRDKTKDGNEFSFERKREVFFVDYRRGMMEQPMDRGIAEDAEKSEKQALRGGRDGCLTGVNVQDLSVFLTKRLRAWTNELIDQAVNQSFQLKLNKPRIRRRNG